MFLSRLIVFTDTSPRKTFVCSELIALPDNASTFRAVSPFRPIELMDEILQFCKSRVSKAEKCRNVSL